jgi:hypothetical protein
MTVQADVWEDTIERLFGQLSELPTCWEDRERPALGPGADGICLLRVTSVPALGVDETRYTFTDDAAPAPDVFPEQTGNRTPVLSVKVDSYDNNARTRARAILERIRTRLRRPSSRAALAKIDTSIATIGTVFAVGRVEDNREYSRAAMDVVLNAAICDADVPFGSIKTIEVSGEITDAADVVVGTPAFTITLPDP